MRTISSFKFVGELLPPINVGRPLASTALLFGKIPAVSKAVAFGAIMQDGILLPGNGDPCTTPGWRCSRGSRATRAIGKENAGSNLCRSRNIDHGGVGAK